jgi:hypothetical protein
MENCCKCDKYKEEQATQNSSITCLEYNNEEQHRKNLWFFLCSWAKNKNQRFLFLAEQLNRIINLEKDNQELKKDKQELNNTINTLNNRIITLENKIIVLENKINNLEKKIILKKSLFNLRRQRYTYFHYFTEEYTDYEINKNILRIFLLIEIRWKSFAFLSNEINCRNLYLLNKLKELSNDQITLINNRIYKHEDLIGEIIKYLDSNVDYNLQINEDKLEIIENWWL